MNQIDNNFDKFKNIPSDINEHFETLKRYSQECDIIIEMGVREIRSTWALLAGNPKIMRSYDFNHPSVYGGNIEEVENACDIKGIDYKFILGNTLDCVIDECDLLFIDTWHDFLQLKSELFRHHSKVNKYIILHDTNSYAFSNERLYENYETERVETNLPKGLIPAIDEFLMSNREWYIFERHSHNNGITVLKRK